VWSKPLCGRRFGLFGGRHVFGPMIVSAVTVQVDGCCRALRRRDDVIEVAASAGTVHDGLVHTVPEFDRQAQRAGRKPAQFGDVEQIAPLVGE